MGNRNARLGLAPSVPLDLADWNVPAVLSRYQLFLDEGAVPRLAAPAGRRAWRVGRGARGEGDAWGGRARNPGRWALGWRSGDRALRPLAEALHSRGGHRGRCRACGGRSGGGQLRGDCARAAEPSGV